MTDTTTKECHEDKKNGEKLHAMLIRLGVLSGLLAVSLFVFSSGIFTIDKKTVVATPTQAVEPIDPFEHVSVEANAAYVYDLAEERILFSKNERSQLPLASLTKLMTALVASELISDKTLITIEEDSIAVDGDSGFHTGERWKFKDLLDYTLLVSSNDGAHAIASVAGAFVHNTGATGESKPKDTSRNFVDEMNRAAISLGLTQSYFINESGLDTNATVGGGYGSARDVASLLAYIVSTHPNLLNATAYETLNFVSEDQYVYDAVNTNTAVGSIPGLIASKTGFTDLAGGNLAIAFDAGINHPVVAVVLGSSFEGRFTDIEKIVSASLKEMAL